MSEAQSVPHRGEIPIEFLWDLSTVYATDEAWSQDIDCLERLLPEVLSLQQTLGQDAQSLLQVLRKQDEINMLLQRLYIYASHRKDSDSTDPKGQALEERIGSIAARVGATMAFIEPAILAIPPEKIAAWQQEEPDLGVYAHALEEIVRLRAHIRSTEVEALLAQFTDITRAPSEIFDILTDADLPFPSIEDENGQQVRLSHARYSRFLESHDRRVRHDAFKGIYSAFGSIQNTLGTILAAEVRSHVINAQIRNYSSALEAALYPHNIPLEVYHNLIAMIRANLPGLHRYMELRKRLLSLDELHVYDLYASLVPDADIAISYPKATEILLEALKPLGAGYIEAVRTAINSRWIDVYENVGKRSGAYSGGAYTTAPFILLNYQDKLRDMFTLAHEMGHSMHSFYTCRTQPFVYGRYTIFVAEVASTLNEVLLTNHLLKTQADPALRRYLIVQQLEDIRTTIFRQTMFAEFELGMHQLVETGEPLTANLLSQRYYDLVGQYHGSSVVLDAEIALEWARIPHFYYDFYVYQYATGLSAALALSRQIVEEGQPAVDRYLRFLSSGSSRSSIDLLRDAGVDMTTPQPIQMAMDTFNGLLDELEALAFTRS